MHDGPRREDIYSKVLRYSAYTDRHFGVGPFLWKNTILRKAKRSAIAPEPCLIYTTYMHDNRKKAQHIWIVFLVTLLTTVTVGVILIYVLFGKKDAPDTSMPPESVSPAVTTAVTARIEKIEPTPESEPESVEEPKTEEDDSRYGSVLADEELCREQQIYSREAVSEDEINLLFAGDISLAKGYAIVETLKSNGGDISAAFSEETLDVMRGADVFMLNNEFTYTRRGEPTFEKQYTFRADPDDVHYLDDMGADIVSLANNHSYDYGEISLLDTLDTLEGDGMPYVGAGHNIDEAARPVYYIVNDVKIGYVSATQIERNEYPDTRGATDSTPGTFRCWYNDRILDVIAGMKNECDYVVVYVHWGTELMETTDWAQDDLAPKLVSAGADLIIGDHPHILQKLDYIGDVPVIYSLGNYWFNSKTMDTGLLEVTLDTEGNTSTVRFIPAIQSGCRTAVVSGDEKARILNYMQSISADVDIDADGYVTKK